MQNSLLIQNSLHLNSTVIEDAAVQGGMQHWIEMECNQLSAGNVVAEVDILEFDTLKVIRASQIATIQKTGATGVNFCGIAYTTTDPQFRFLENKINTPDTLFFLPEFNEYDVIVPAGSQTAYIALDQEKLIENARILNPKQWEKAPQSLLMFNGHQPILKSTLTALFNAAAKPITIDTQLEQLFLKKSVLDIILQIVTSDNIDLLPSYSVCLSSFQTYQSARTYIEDQLNINVTPSIVSICKSVGVSERVLQYAFRAYVNMAPTAYLRLRRLNRVRTLLYMSDPKTTTVTNIAMRFGFLHLGRFALNYKQIFHESPSVTFNK
jgi:AraC family ethanolamine operon transcriptional activator